MKTIILFAVTLLSVLTLNYIDNQSNIASIKFDREVFKTANLMDLVNVLKFRESITIITVSNAIPKNGVVKGIIIYRFLNDSIDAVVTIGRYGEENSYIDFMEVECRLGDSVSMLMNEIRFYRQIGILSDSDILDETLLYRSIQRRSLLKELGIDLPEIMYGSLLTSSQNTATLTKGGPLLQYNESTIQSLAVEEKHVDLRCLRNVFISFAIALTIAIASYFILKRI